MKKKLIAATALALSTFALASCGATNQKLTLSPNWEIGILSEATTATAEELTYSVTFEENSFMQKDHFTVEYCGKDNSTPGTYTTKLEYLADNTYRYTTVLTLPVTFTIVGGESVTKTDEIETVALFHKADKSRSADPDGVGLGLYIVKTILNSHGEDIFLTSENGVTTFTFTLPAVR